MESNVARLIWVGEAILLAQTKLQAFDFFFEILLNQGFENEVGGSGEIRTHGRLPVAGFQDQCLKPLGHASRNALL